jgi:hypothetical protein
MCVLKALRAAALGGKLSKAQQLWSVEQHTQFLLAGHIQHLQFQLSQREAQEITGAAVPIPAGLIFMGITAQALLTDTVGASVLTNRHINGLAAAARALAAMEAMEPCMRGVVQAGQEHIHP